MAHLQLYQQATDEDSHGQKLRFKYVILSCEDFCGGEMFIFVFQLVFGIIERQLMVVE